VGKSISKNIDPRFLFTFFATAPVFCGELPMTETSQLPDTSLSDKMSP
jgi:hypothetical protein